MSNHSEQLNTGAIIKSTNELSIKHPAMDLVAERLEKRRTFLNRLFKTPEDKEILRSQLALIRTHNEFSERSLAAFCEVRLEALHAMWEDFLIRGKARITADQAAYLAQERGMLSERIHDLATKFYKAIDVRYDSLSEVRNPAPRQAAERAIERDLKEFDALLDSLLSKFNAALEFSLRGALRR